MLNLLLQLPPTLVISAVGLLLGALLTLAISALNWLRKRTKSQFLLGLYDRLERVTRVIAAAMDQEVVDGLKAAAVDGKLTREEIDAVGRDALHRAKTTLGAAAVAELDRATKGKADEAIRAHLEAAVAARRAAGATS